jgi:hypothetical protein
MQRVKSIVVKLNGSASTKAPARQSGTFLSFAAFLRQKRNIEEGDFHWVEPLKARDPNLFTFALTQVKRAKIRAFFARLRPSFHTLLTLTVSDVVAPEQHPDLRRTASEHADRGADKRRS